MSDRDDDEDDEEMLAQWSDAGVSVIYEFRSGGDGGGAGGGGGGGGASSSDADAETTIVYEYRTDSDDSVAGGGFAPAPSADDIAVGGLSPDAASGLEPTAAARTRARVPWTGIPKPSVWLTNEATTRFGIGHPTNTGSGILIIAAYDAQGTQVGGFTLEPGQGLDWYYPPSSAMQIGVAHAHVDPSPDSELTYDTPIY